MWTSPLKLVGSFMYFLIFQAQFSEVSLIAHADGNYSVNVQAFRNGTKVVK